jgi:quinol monooxygenase YgiN
MYAGDRYESQAVLDNHRSQEYYGGVFKTITEEGLFAGEPEIVEYKTLAGFRR